MSGAELSTKKIGPFVFESHLNGANNLQFLTEELPVLLENVSLQIRANMWFQHDGWTANYLKILEHFWTNVFRIGGWGGVVYRRGLHALPSLQCLISTCGEELKIWFLPNHQLPERTWLGVLYTQLIQFLQMQLKLLLQQTLKEPIDALNRMEVISNIFCNFYCY